MIKTENNFTVVLDLKSNEVAAETIGKILVSLSNIYSEIGKEMSINTTLLLKDIKIKRKKCYICLREVKNENND